MGCINRTGAEYSGAAVLVFFTAKNPLQLPVVKSQTRTHTRARTHTYTHTHRALLFIPRNSRKVKADSIEPCTKEDLAIIFPRFVGCRPPATGCTHIRIQSSRVYRELRFPSLSLFLLPPSSPRQPLFYSAPLAWARERVSRLSILFLIFFFAVQAHAECASDLCVSNLCAVYQRKKHFVLKSQRRKRIWNTSCWFS